MDKASITLELVSDLVATQFPHWARLPVSPVDLAGHDNTTFRLGDELAVRLPSADEYRGGPLTLLDADTRQAIAALAHELEADAATAIWEAALASVWERPSVWVHGDVANSNLLVMNGRLCAVLDFGCSAVGDPACDLAIAWTFFTGESREAFRDALAFDEGTWARGRGWALWKALMTRVKVVRSGGQTVDAARRFGRRLSSRGVLDEVVAHA